MRSYSPNALLLLCAMLCAFPLFAKKFEYSPLARSTYRQIFRFQTEEAQRSLEKIRSSEGDNLIVHHLENYLDFFRIYASEDQALYANLRKNEALRLRQVQLGDERSPFYLYVQADILLQWAFLKFRFGDYLSAFSSISKAHKLLIRNQEKFPNFLPNLKNLGILHAMVGAIPDNYRWGARLLGGLRGSIRQGTEELETILKKAKIQDYLFEEETLILYAYVLMNFANQPEKAWQTVDQAGLKPVSNLLHCFLKASVAMQCKRNDEALRVLQHQPQQPGLLSFPYMDYLSGLARLRKLDPGASEHFLRFLRAYKGSNGIKEAYQKLAWAALLRNDNQAYERYAALILSKGVAETGADKNAQKEAESKKKPSVLLLKARLLFDGGYLSKALELMQSTTPEAFENIDEQIEYHYRTGRILHAIGNTANALSSYRKTIDLGKAYPFYFACNAALQTGLIYEQQRNAPLARQYFRLCLSLSPQDYRTSLHQSAKAGLNRLDDE